MVRSALPQRGVPWPVAVGTRVPYRSCMSRQDLERELLKHGLVDVDAARIAAGMEFYFGPLVHQFLIAPYKGEKHGDVVTVRNANGDGVMVVHTDSRTFRAPVNPDFSY